MDLDSVDLNELRYEALSERPSKVQLADLGQPVRPGATIADWLDGLALNGSAAMIPLLHAAVATRLPAAVAAPGANGHS